MVVCLQCGDKGWENAFVFCIKCLEVPVHRYCLDEIPKTFEESVRWVCDFCIGESPAVAHLKSSADEVDGTGVENEPLLQSVDELVSKEDSEISGVCNPSGAILRADNDSNLSVKTDVEESQIGSPEQINEPQGVEAVAGSSPLKEGPMRHVEDSPPGAILRADNDSDLSVKTDVEESQIGSPQQINEPQGVEAVAGGSPLKEGPMRHVESSPLKEGPMRHVESSPLEEGPMRHVESSPLKEGPMRHVEGSSPSVAKGKSSRKKVRKLFTPRKKAKKLPPVQDEKEAVCFHCQKKGHFKRNCYEFRAFLKKQKANSEQKKQTHGARMPLHRADRERDSDPNEQICQFPAGSPDCLAQPLVTPIWRGSLNLLNNGEDPLEGFVAHLSNKACQKAFEEATMLPSLLHVTLLPKAVVWPKSFENKLPTDDSIALYVFPADRRYERIFDLLVEDMRRREFAMIATVTNAELLIFTSRELPQLYWRFRNKYYLWGVFRRKQASSYPEVKRQRFPNPLLR